MNETLQNLRTKAHELLDLANVDPGFKQLLQVNPELALANVPNHAFAQGAEEDNCGWTCWWTCAWTSMEQQ